MIGDLSRRAALSLLDGARSRLVKKRAPPQTEACGNFRFSYGPPPPATPVRESIRSQIKRAAKYTACTLTIVLALIIGVGYWLNRNEPTYPPASAGFTGSEVPSRYNGPVHVRGYYNSHGTYVDGYDRSRPHHK